MRLLTAAATTKNNTKSCFLVVISCCLFFSAYLVKFTSHNRSWTRNSKINWGKSSHSHVSYRCNRSRFLVIVRKWKPFTSEVYMNLSTVFFLLHKPIYFISQKHKSDLLNLENDYKKQITQQSHQFQLQLQRVSIVAYNPEICWNCAARNNFGA